MMIITQATDFSFPVIDGLHFSDGCVYPTTTDDEGRVSVITFPLTIAVQTYQTTTLYPEREFSAEDEAHLFVAGSGAWEGEGFLALIQRQSRKTLWVLYSQQAEAFVSAQSSCGIVHAISEEYPFTTQWRINASQPPELVGIRSHVA